MDDTTKSSPFVKQLASSDRHARNDALESLRVYLRGHKGLNELELLKLWKGLFYCMWMSDKRPVQQRLANDLAGLVDIMPSETVLPFLSAFWKTIAREWTGIDRLRMDKFLLLIRRYLNASFSFLARKQWKKTSAIASYIDILKETPLNTTNNRIPDGLRLHVVDIYVDELDKVDESREGKIPLEQLLEPLKVLGKASPSKSVRNRVKEALQDERLADWNGTGESKDVQEDDEVEAEDNEWAGIEE